MTNAQLLKRPVITEKSLYLANKHNSYTFEVQPTATKTQIAKAVEEVFAVKVLDVQTTMRSKALRRTGKRRLLEIVPRKKKAVVTLAKGQSIVLFDLTEGKK